MFKPPSRQNGQGELVLVRRPSPIGPRILLLHHTLVNQRESGTTNGATITSRRTITPVTAPIKPHYRDQTGNANLVSGVAENEAEDLGLVLHTTIDGVSLPRDIFVVDSGASPHVVAHESLLQNLNPPSAVKQRVKLGDGRIVPVAGQGRTRLGPVTLDKVLLVPDLAFNLIAVNKMPDHLRWSFSTKTADLADPTTQTKYLSAPWEHNSYLCRKASSPARALAAPVTDDLLEWHLRLGHLSVQKVIHLARKGRLGRDILKHATTRDISDLFCEDCIKGKTGRLPSPPAPDIRAPKPLELLHMDIWGPAPVVTTGGMRYFLTIYDDYSHTISLTLLRTKADAIQGFKNFVALAENQIAQRVKSVRTDGGGEFTSRVFRQFVQDKGIEHVIVPPGAHAQNGRVEARTPHHSEWRSHYPQPNWPSRPLLGGGRQIYCFFSQLLI